MEEYKQDAGAEEEDFKFLIGLCGVTEDELTMEAEEQLEDLSKERSRFVTLIKTKWLARYITILNAYPVFCNTFKSGSYDYIKRSRFQYVSVKQFLFFRLITLPL
jgi:hypothetical protein